ncbi:MAG: class II fumarate hydratase, partial [Deltaproteobacteria bacterium]|nr:class II fumarate hydratase [Deltaproteobacteria bacterium]
MKYRHETDSMGIVNVPVDVYYGAQTMRAVKNFPISGLRFPPCFIHTIALIKKCAATVNLSFNLIEEKYAQAIIAAAKEVMAGQFDADFIVDVFQTGSGTSTNMNVNEVIATRANEILTGIRNTKIPVHPNDHVNLCQSSNDVIPSAMHIYACSRIAKKLVPALASLDKELKIKANEFKHIKKIGRTHLQDAVVMSLGDEFSGYARQAELSVQRLETVCDRLSRLALGGTAIGTGLNAAKGFADRVISMISVETGILFSETPNHYESQAAMDTAVETSGILKTVAVTLMKIANDIRWLASGPRCGLGEINIPSLQPGSSIMPGKVNPVISEAVIQVAAQVIGNDAAITMGGSGSYFELNTMIPLIAYNLLQSIDLLANAADVLAKKCVTGITANLDQCADNVKKSLAIVTGLIPHIGYDRAAALAQKAFDTGR